MTLFIFDLTKHLLKFIVLYKYIFYAFVYDAFDERVGMFYTDIDLFFTSF